MNHGEEWPARVPSRNEINRLVRDDVGYVALLDVLAFGVDEDGVEVLTLPRQNRPLVETGRFVRRSFTEMPLPEHCRLISTRPKVLGNIGKVFVDLAVQGMHTIDVVVSSGENGRSARRTNGAVGAYELGSEATETSRIISTAHLVT